MNTLLIMSITGAVMILIIALLRLLLQNRLHRTVILLFWAVAALRLTIPVVVPSSASVYNYVPEREAIQIPIERAPEVNPPVLVAPPVAVPEELPVRYTPGETNSYVGPVSEPVFEISSEDSYENLMTWVWIAGCGICVLYFLWIHIRARLQYRFALPEEAPAYLGKIRLKRLDTISSPLVYGFFRPVILLPSGFPKKDSPEYEQVLYHEMTHVRSGDLWIKLLMLVITCVHWFNPCVWLMLHLLSQDLELRCDARVIRKLGGKKKYAMALVQAEIGKTQHFAEAAFAFSLTELRLKAIAKAKVYLPRSIILCVILSTVLLLCFATGPEEGVTDMDASEGQDDLISVTTSCPPTEPVRETYPETSAETYVETIKITEKPSPNFCLDEEQRMEYLLSCGFEEYGSVTEISLKEGQRKTISLRLPQYAVFSTNSYGKDLANVVWEYSYDENLYYLTVNTYDEGELTVDVSIAGKQWMKVEVHISYDLYYSIPDAWRFEDYQSFFEIKLPEDGTTTVSLKLPARTTYTYNWSNGNILSENDMRIRTWYDYESQLYYIEFKAYEFGYVSFDFYVDGVYWCRLRFNVTRDRPQYSNNSGTNSTYEYLSQLGPQPAVPGYSGSTGVNNGPIIVWEPIFTGNGQMINPGVYWP